MLQTPRKAGGSLVITVPKAFIEQNGLNDGSRVELHLAGKKMTVEARNRPRYKPASLMAEMPEGLPRIEGWDETPSVGLEGGGWRMCRIAGTLFTSNWTPHPGGK
ncbi:MAG: AbrB/MazE/SpoVT family DNA-binding domain-containing protein [Dokdonella sp.]|uniref:AbrB/MazE/SpoVT family DNA-binding domain-containing protein n=1 Tax=Dokdonella sp. TaxID=2291710 RepID=UPI003BB1D4C9